jgi:DNA-binding MarR family transcriptional regulator
MDCRVSSHPQKAQYSEYTDWKLYEWIDEHPNLSRHELAKSINWSHGKVYSSVKRLTDDGLVNVENNIGNGRSVSIVIYKKCRISSPHRNWMRCAAGIS